MFVRSWFIQFENQFIMQLFLWFFFSHRNPDGQSNYFKLILNWTEIIWIRFYWGLAIAISLKIESFKIHDSN